MKLIRSRPYAAASLVVLFAAAGLALLLAGQRAPRAEEQAPAPAPVPAQPQQTSASFGDWIARCQRIGASGKNACEAAQSLVIKGQSGPIAEIAVSQAEKPVTITVLLPTNIAFDKSPQIGTDEAHMVTLAYRRCVPGGCLADAKLEAAALAALRGATKPGRLVFTDAAERTLALPVSFRGLAQALDNLAKPTAVR